MRLVYVRKVYLFTFTKSDNMQLSKKIQLKPLTLVNLCPFCCYSDDVSGVWL